MQGNCHGGPGPPVLGPAALDLRVCGGGLAPAPRPPGPRAPGAPRARGADEPRGHTVLAEATNVRATRAAPNHKKNLGPALHCGLGHARAPSCRVGRCHSGPRVEGLRAADNLPLHCEASSLVVRLHHLHVRANRQRLWLKSPAAFLLPMGLLAIEMDPLHEAAVEIRCSQDIPHAPGRSRAQTPALSGVPPMLRRRPAGPCPNPPGALGPLWDSGLGGGGRPEQGPLAPNRPAGAPLAAQGPEGPPGAGQGASLGEMKNLTGVCPLGAGLPCKPWRCCRSASGGPKWQQSC